MIGHSLGSTSQMGAESAKDKREEPDWRPHAQTVLQCARFSARSQLGANGQAADGLALTTAYPAGLQPAIGGVEIGAVCCLRSLVNQRPDFGLAVARACLCAYARTGRARKFWAPGRLMGGVRRSDRRAYCRVLRSDPVRRKIPG